MADCYKGEKYSKGFLNDSGKGVGEHGEEEQEANFNDFSGADKEFVTGYDTLLLMVRGCVLRLEKWREMMGSATIFST